jgi:hypothetical protein
MGACCSVVGWGTMLRAGRSRVRFPMRSSDFSIGLIHSGRLRWPSGLSHELSSIAQTPEPWFGIPLRALLCSVCAVCVFLRLCTGRGLATSWSPVQGALPTVLDLVNEVKWKVSWRRPRPELGSRAKGKKSFQPHYVPGVDSASNRNKYQESSWERQRATGS